MTIQPILYRGRLVAAATAQRFYLSDELLTRPPGDPEVTFVVMMCSYARDVANGVLAGPYHEADARRYARACLIPAELVEREGLDVVRAAQALQVPAQELRAERSAIAAGESRRRTSSRRRRRLSWPWFVQF